MQVPAFWAYRGQLQQAVACGSTWSEQSEVLQLRGAEATGGVAAPRNSNSVKSIQPPGTNPNWLCRDLGFQPH
jgi:hypothetical protein